MPPKGYKCKVSFTNKVVVPPEQPLSQEVRAVGAVRAVVHNLLVAVDLIMAAADMTLPGPSAQQEPSVVDLTKDAGQPLPADPQQQQQQQHEQQQQQQSIVETALQPLMQSQSGAQHSKQLSDAGLVSSLSTQQSSSKEGSQLEPGYREQEVPGLLDH